MFTLSNIAVGLPQPSATAGLPPKRTAFQVHPRYCLQGVKVHYSPGEHTWSLFGKQVEHLAGNYCADLYLGIDEFGGVWILVATHAGGNKVRTAMERAKTVWMVRDEDGTFKDCPGYQAQPNWPNPLDDQVFVDFLNAAFMDHFIDDPEHPLLKKPAAPF